MKTFELIIDYLNNNQNLIKLIAKRIYIFIINHLKKWYEISIINGIIYRYNEVQYNIKLLITNIIQSFFYHNDNLRLHAKCSIKQAITIKNVNSVEK